MEAANTTTGSATTEIYAHKSIHTTPITLTKEDPLERLRELCEICAYTPSIFLDVFPNGVMCQIDLDSGFACSTTISEMRFVTLEDGTTTGEKDVEVLAVKVVAAVLLNRLGLGVAPAESEAVDEKSAEDAETEEMMKRLSSTTLRFATAALGGMLSEGRV